MARTADMTTLADLSAPTGDDMTAFGAADMATPASKGGCGCRIGGGRTPGDEPFAALVVLAVVLVVRRRSPARVS